MRHVLALFSVLTLAGCAADANDFGRVPQLSPVGTGVYQYPLQVQPAVFPPEPPGGRNSLWTDRASDYFTDPRATDIGDIVTVKIHIEDEAQLANNSERERTSGLGLGLDFDAALNGIGLGELGGDVQLEGVSSAGGDGSIRRSEEIDLSVAAVVTRVLPNGNLLIQGQQEVRVNYEVRVLSIAGIIRPRDILPNNTISYDKIAEARISYGGRGRISEIQQPRWGQQIVDVAAPW